MGRAALAGRRHRHRKRRSEAYAVGQLDQEIGAGVRDEPFAVRPDFYGLARRLCLHLPGVLLSRWEWVGKPHSQDPGGRSRQVSQVLIGGSGLVAESESLPPTLGRI